MYLYFPPLYFYRYVHICHHFFLFYAKLADDIIIAVNNPTFCDGLIFGEI